MVLNKLNSNQIVVKKFGGTSVGSIERIQSVAERVKQDQDRGEKPILVVSAMSGETNRLISLAHRISPLDRGPAYDMLVASGEQVSVSLLSMALTKLGTNAQPLLAHQLDIRTDSTHAKARIKSINKQMLLNLTDKNIIPVIAGFQGIGDDESITTLGRGGSDTSAVAIAAALSLPTCEIYTDVPAVYTADPRLVPKAKEMKQVSIDEMMEMASLGSKVLHTRSVELAGKYNIKIHLRSTFEKREGTWIVPEVSLMNSSMENPLVTGITHDDNTTVIKIYPIPSDVSFIADLFKKLAEAGVVVDIISQSHANRGQRLAFSVSKEDSLQAEKITSSYIPSNCKIEIIKDVSKVSIVGMGMKNQFGVAARFFDVLAKQKSNLHLVTTSEIKISAVIDQKFLSPVANALHTEFNLDQTEDM